MQDSAIVFLLNINYESVYFESTMHVVTIILDDLQRLNQIGILKLSIAKNQETILLFYYSRWQKEQAGRRFSSPAARL